MLPTKGQRQEAYRKRLPFGNARSRGKKHRAIWRHDSVFTARAPAAGSLTLQRRPIIAAHTWAWAQELLRTIELLHRGYVAYQAHFGGADAALPHHFDDPNSLGGLGGLSWGGSGSLLLGARGALWRCCSAIWRGLRTCAPTGCPSGCSVPASAGRCSGVAVSTGVLYLLPGQRGAPRRSAARVPRFQSPLHEA